MVSKRSGDPPSISHPGSAALPSAISAKLCIDEAGRVATVEILSRVPSDTAAEIVAALRTWRYAPYQVAGAPHAACFAVAFRVR
jgi:hypothetical protein